MRTTKMNIRNLMILLGLLLNLNVIGQNGQFKVRALWADPSGFESPEAVDQMISKCQRAGINTIIPDVMVGENVYFKSKHFIGNVQANDKFDPLDYMIKKAHAAGMKIQAWSCVYYTKPLKKEWISQSFDRNPQSQIFLSPAHPEVNPYLISVIKEMLAYDIDGIHLDYCRYCNAAFDYSDAARKGCQKSLGFDPLNFIDHPELIVPAQKDPFSIRVLHPKTSIDRVWESGVVERNLNRAGVGFALISESPQNIDALKVPGLLVISHYTDVSPEMSAAVTRYVNRGGNLLWIDPSNGVFMKNPELQKLTGLSGTQTFAKRVTLQKTGNDALSRLIPTQEINTSGNILQVSNATILAKFSTGEPIITINQVAGRDARRASKVMVVGLRAMESNDDSVILMLKGIMNWYRAESGVKAPDLLAQKRNQWIKWRADQILPLVREINKAVKAKDSKLVVTSSAGVGPQQYCGVYRDGGYWLTEKINDMLFPMNYTVDPDELVDMLKEQEYRTPKGMSDRIFPGLRLYGNKDKPTMDPAVVEKQMNIVKQRGSKGYCLFATKFLSDDLIQIVSKFSR